MELRHSTTRSRKPPTAAWRPDGLLKTLLVWSAATFVIFWLPAVRGLMDGSTYEWDLFGFRGSGIAGAYWFPVVASALAVAFLALGWRGARFPFALLLPGWHGLLVAGATRLALTRPEDFRFRGDTLGVDFSLAWLGPVLFGGFFLLALIWLLRGRRRTNTAAVPAWNARNWRLAAIATGLLPVQFVLLRFGPPHGVTDQAGVLLTMAQWGLISVALYPWRARTADVSEAHMLRRATPSDISSIQRVRRSVHENRLESFIVTDEDVRAAMTGNGRGWVIEVQGELVGFAIGNSKSGNVWALFVHPDHERRGYGRRLHDAMLGWLWSQELDCLWLTTEPGTRAQRFYEAAGWQRVGPTGGGELRYEMRRAGN